MRLFDTIEYSENIIIIREPKTCFRIYFFTWNLCNKDVPLYR